MINIINVIVHLWILIGVWIGYFTLSTKGFEEFDKGIKIGILGSTGNLHTPLFNLNYKKHYEHSNLDSHALQFFKVFTQDSQTPCSLFRKYPE